MVGRLARFVQFQARLWRYCAWRLRQNNLTAMAAALSFHTIFALIPTLVLVLLTLSSLGLLEDSKRSLRDFLVASGFARIGISDQAATMQPNLGDSNRDVESAPTTNEGATNGSAPAGNQSQAFNVAAEILSLVEKVQGQLTIQRIGPIGIALFIWTAISLLSIMEDALNRVFGAARNRSVLRRSLMYWAVLTLGPVALAITAYFGQSAMSAAMGMPLLSSVTWLAGMLGPLLVGVLMLAATYILLPNTAVNRQAAVGGALAAVLLWLVARWGFALYIERFVVSGNLYGILGALPLFLLWLYLSWLVFLFGAELAHTAANLQRLDVPDDLAPQIVTPMCAVRIMTVLARSFQSGRGGMDAAGAAGESGVPAEATAWLLSRMASCGLVVECGQEPPLRYLPARPAEQILINELLQVCEADRVGESARGEQTARFESHVAEKIRTALSSTTLAELAGRELPEK